MYIRIECIHLFFIKKLRKTIEKVYKSCNNKNTNWYTRMNNLENNNYIEVKNTSLSYICIYSVIVKVMYYELD